MKKLTKLAVLFALVFSVSACTFVAGNSFYGDKGMHDAMHSKHHHGRMLQDLKGKTSAQVKEELGKPSSETSSMLVYNKGQFKKQHKGKKMPKHAKNSLVKVYLEKDKVTKVEHVVVFD